LPAVRQSDLSRATLQGTLESYGILLPKSELVESAADAIAAADRIGFPVALKIRCDDILHKPKQAASRSACATARRCDRRRKNSSRMRGKRSRQPGFRASWCRKW